MFNADPSVPCLTTEQIQKYLEENKELILAIMECQRQGRLPEISQFQAKLQHNLTFLAKLADAVPPGQTQSQGQGMEHPNVATSQQQPDVSIQQHNLPLDVNDHQYQQQQQQQHLAMSIQQPDLSASKLSFQMSEQHHKVPGFFQQQQFFPVPMSGLAGNNSGIYQSPQGRLNNLSDTVPSSNQFGSDVSPGWFLGM